MGQEVPAPLILSLDDGDAQLGPESLRGFLERLVTESAKRAQTLIGDAEPGRQILVSPPMRDAEMRGQIDAAVALVVEKFGERWPSPHVTDFGLREMYAHAREPWLARRGLEALVMEGKMGVVTIFCHEWVHEVCRRVALENGLSVETSIGDYIRTGKIRVASTNAFRIDVFANLQAMAANFDPIDTLATKVLVLAAVSGDETLAARLRGSG